MRFTNQVYDARSIKSERSQKSVFVTEIRKEVIQTRYIN